MSAKTLLREWVSLDYTPDLIKESQQKNGGRIILPAVFQKAETKNQNGRVYPRQLLEREFNNYQKAIRESRAYGELDHPTESTVSLQKACLIIREAMWDGDTVRGTIEVLPTPMGKILSDILSVGGKVGLSSRGVGSTEKTNEGVDMVQDDFQLCAIDAVADPSTPGANINESRLVTPVVLSKADRVFRAVNDIVLRKRG